MSTSDPTPAPTSQPEQPAAPGLSGGPPLRITPPYYPIVYVRGYAMSSSEREETFHDAYYGFAATSVEKREVSPPDYFEADVFEGQLIRFMKTNGYVDSSNLGLESADPARNIWICRFYDKDFFQGTLRPITDHADDLRTLVCQTIPKRLEARGFDLGPDRQDYRVILIAHSMGGLVCRTLIQNLLPADNQDPKRWIYRLVTLGSPHRGIDLGNVPSFIQDLVEQVFNPFDSKMFQPDEIKRYLKLQDGYEPHSLGDPQAQYAFPVKRCLCLIGSDYHSYTLAKAATGSVSDGLVKQSNAYIVSGAKPPESSEYDDEHRAFWANVHRAHSGNRGIVNSYESYENIQRFLFGDTMAALSLENSAVPGSPPPGFTFLYDVEFALTIRGTGVYLHRRQQDPCENALRFKREPPSYELPKHIHLHTGFLNSRLRLSGDYFSNFLLRFRVVERRIKTSVMGWDREYPDRPIYSESLEIRIGDPLTPGQTHPLEYRWLADAGAFQALEPAEGRYQIPLRPAPAFSATFAIQVSRWPDGPPATTAGASSGAR